MVENDKIRSRASVAYLVLYIASLLLIFGSVYLLRTLSLLYGIGLGASLQVSPNIGNVIPLIQPITAQLQIIGISLTESYVIFIVSLMLTGISFFLLINRKERPGRDTSKYTFLHAGLTLVYVLLFYIASESLFAELASIYIYAPYLGAAVSLSASLYIEYLIRSHVAKAAKGVTMLSIDPSRPFANYMALQDRLFPGMGGHLRIIDKHFNSTALSNLYRFCMPSIHNFKKITILTSVEMMDSHFSEDVKDFRKELTIPGVDLETRIMNESDAIEQHERFLMDDHVAYKIPPFNIINKKSEHITRINFKDAAKRFAYLYDRSTKIENYEAVKDRK